MRRHVAATTRSQATCGFALVVLGHGVGDGCGAVVGGGHRVLERAPRGEMFALADTALDLFVSELFLEALLLDLAASRLRLLGLHVLPVPAGPEHNVLADRRRVGLWPLGFPLFQTELGPFPPLRHHGVHSLLVDGRAGLARHPDLAPLVVESVGYRRLGAVLVDCGDWRGEGGWVDLFRVGHIVCPVGAAV